MLHPQEEEKLIAAAIGGDRKAINDLCGHYLGFVFDVAILIVKQEVLAEEVMQTVMMKFVDYLNKDRLTNKSNCRGFLATTTRNASIDLLSKRRRFSFIDNWDDEHESLFELTEQENTTELYDKKVAILIMELKKIPLIDQAIITAYYIHDQKYAKLAHDLSVSEEYAKKRVAHVRRALKNKLKGI